MQISTVPKLILSLSLILAPSVSHVSAAYASSSLDFSQVSSRRFGPFVWYPGRVSSLTVDDENVTFVRNGKTLTVVRRANYRLYHLIVKRDNFQFDSYVKVLKSGHSKIGLLSERSIKFTNPVLNKNSSKCEPEPVQISTAEDAALLSALSEAGTSQMIRCDISTAEQRKLKRLVAEQLDPQQSFLIKCLKSSGVDDKLKKQGVKYSTSQLLANYLDEIQLISSGKRKLFVGCQSQKESSVSIRADTKLPPEKQVDKIMFASGSGSLIQDACKTEPQLLAHEFGHLGVLGAESNGGASLALDRVCSEQLGLGFEKNEKCKAEYYDIKKQGGSGSGALVAITTNDVGSKSLLASNKKIQQKLQASTQSTDLKPISDQDVTILASATNGNVPQGALDRVSASMSTTMDNMEGRLNTAVGGGISEARADDSGSSSSTTRYRDSSSSRSPASDSGTPSSSYHGQALDKNGEYTAEEILADRYAPTPPSGASSSSQLGMTDIGGQVARAAPVNNGATSDDSASRAPTQVQSSVSSASSRNSGSSARAAAGIRSNAGGGIASSGSGGGGPGSRSGARAQAAAVGTSGGQRGPASIGGPVRGPSSVGGEAPVPIVASPIVQQLATADKVEPESYNEIRKQYSDPSFNQQLKSSNISLEVISGSRTIRLGKTTQPIAVRYRDDGKNIWKLN